MPASHSTRFLATPDLWQALTDRSARAKRRRWVASAYFGTESAARLTLKAGDWLLTSCGERSAATRVVSPHELLSLEARGVRCFARPELHGKVYLFDDTAIIGSPNVSEASERYYDEAAVITCEPHVVRAVEAWFRERCTEPMGRAVLARLAKVYDAAPSCRWLLEPTGPAPKRGGRTAAGNMTWPAATRATQEERDEEAHRQGVRPWLWLARVTLNGGPTSQVWEASERDVERARRRTDLNRTAGTELTSLVWSYESRMSRTLVPGDWIVYAWWDGDRQFTSYGGRLLLPPRRVPTRRRPGVSMVLEVPFAIGEEAAVSWRAFARCCKAAGVSLRPAERQSRALATDPHVARRFLKAFQARLRQAQ